jgi:hypothetical protein
MPVETATYVSQLDPSLPAHTDGLNQADSHARLIKSALQATFPNFTAVALSATQAQIDAAINAVLGTVAIRYLLGSAALPGITPVGDPNTGIYSPGADQLGFAVNGVAAATSRGGQDVGLHAATSPSQEPSQPQATPFRWNPRRHRKPPSRDPRGHRHSVSSPEPSRVCAATFSGL